MSASSGASDRNNTARPLIRAHSSDAQECHILMKDQKLIFSKGSGSQETDEVAFASVCRMQSPFTTEVIQYKYLWRH